MAPPNDPDQALLDPQPDPVSDLIRGVVKHQGRRLILTALVLSVFWTTRYIPLPFVDVRAIDGFGATDGQPRWSLGQLGVLTWVQAYVIIGLLRCVRAWVFSRFQGGFHDITPYASPVLLLTMVLGGFQAWVIADQIGLFEGLTSTSYHGPIAIGLLARLGLAIVAASVIDKHGVGHGFWLVFALPIIVEAPATILAAVRSASINGIHPLEVSAVYLVQIVLLAGLTTHLLLAPKTPSWKSPDLLLLSIIVPLMVIPQVLGFTISGFAFWADAGPDWQSRIWSALPLALMLACAVLLWVVLIRHRARRLVPYALMLPVLLFGPDIVLAAFPGSLAWYTPLGEVGLLVVIACLADGLRQGIQDGSPASSPAAS